MAHIHALVAGGMASEHERVRRALLSPRERAVEDVANTQSQKRFDAMTDQELDDFINGQMKARAEAIGWPSAQSAAPSPEGSQ